MTMTYSNIEDEIEKLFKKERVHTFSIKTIFIPEDWFAEFERNTIGQGFNCTWWGVPVKASKGTRVPYFILF